MRAARYYGVLDVRLEDVPKPHPARGEVQVAVALNGICGSDLHEFYDGPRAVPVDPHPLTGVSIPVILGHETCGYISSIGPGVDDLAEGDLVAIDPLRACHRCFACRSGRHNLCDRLAIHGYSTGSGGLAEFTVAPADMVHRAPEGMTPEQAALIEPLAIARHAVHRWDVHPGAAAIFGGGPIGIGILLTLKTVGVLDVILVEPAADRREVAGRLGAATVDPTDQDVSVAIREATAGRGVDVAFETAGAPTSFASAVSSTGKGGTVVVVASGRHRVVAPLAQLLRSEITVRTTYASCGDFPPVIASMADGAYPLDGWVSTIGLDDLHLGFDRLHKGECIKLLVDPRRR